MAWRVWVNVWDCDTIVIIWKTCTVWLHEPYILALSVKLIFMERIVEYHSPLYPSSLHTIFEFWSVQLRDLSVTGTQLPDRNVSTCPLARDVRRTSPVSGPSACKYIAYIQIPKYICAFVCMLIHQTPSKYVLDMPLSSVDTENMQIFCYVVIHDLLSVYVHNNWKDENQTKISRHCCYLCFLDNVL